MRFVSSSIRNAPLPRGAGRTVRRNRFDSPIGTLTPGQKAMWDGMDESERELTKVLFNVPDADVRKIDLTGRSGFRKQKTERRKENGQTRFLDLEEEDGTGDGQNTAPGAAGSGVSYGLEGDPDGQNRADSTAGRAAAAGDSGGADAAYRELLLKKAQKDPRLYSNPNFIRELSNAEQRMGRNEVFGTVTEPGYGTERNWRELAGGVLGAVQNGVNALGALGREVQAGGYASGALDQRFFGKLTGNEKYNDRADYLLDMSVDAADRALEPAADFGSRYRAKTEELYPNTGPAQRFLNQVISGSASMAPSIVGNLLLPGSGLYVNMLQSIGGAMVEARDRGADGHAALAYGVTVGIADTMLEKLVDGLGGVFGKGLLNEMLGDEVRRAAASPGAREALIYLSGMAGEGFEEFLSVFVQELLETHMLGKTARTWEALLGEAGLSFFTGALVSGLVQGAARLGELVASGTDILTAEELGKRLAGEVEAELRETPERTEPTKTEDAFLHGDADYAEAPGFVGEPELDVESEVFSGPEQIDSDFTIDSEAGQEYNKKLPKEIQVRVNYIRGTAFGKRMFSVWENTIAALSSEITIVTADGTRTRIDAIGIDENDPHRIIILEFKSSEKARLTKNQQMVFAELQEHEAYVVGRGKGIFTKGKRIPPVSEGTKIIVQRPGHWEEWINVNDT